MSTYRQYQAIADQFSRLPLKEELVLMGAISVANTDAAREPLVEKLVRHNIGLALAVTFETLDRASFLLDDGAAEAVAVMYEVARRSKNVGNAFFTFAAPRIKGVLFELKRRHQVVSQTRYGLTKAKESGEGPAAALVLMSMDAKVSDFDNRSIGDTFVSEEDTPDTLAERELDMEFALAELPERSRRIIQARYGIGPEFPRPLSAVEVGALLDLHPERIRQIEKESLDLMKVVLA